MRMQDATATATARFNEEKGDPPPRIPQTASSNPTSPTISNSRGSWGNMQHGEMTRSPQVRWAEQWPKWPQRPVIILGFKSWPSERVRQLPGDNFERGATREGPTGLHPACQHRPGLPDLAFEPCLFRPVFPPEWRRGAVKVHRMTSVTNGWKARILGSVGSPTLSDSPRRGDGAPLKLTRH